MATVDDWLQRFAASLGVPPPGAEDVEALLALAGIAARASERTAAPISTWLVALAGLPPAEALTAAKALSAELAGAEAAAGDVE